SPYPRLTRARTAAVRSPRSSTWAERRERCTPWFRLDGAQETFESLFVELTERQRTRPAGSSSVEALDAGVHAQGKKVLEEAREGWLGAADHATQRYASAHT